MTNKPGIIVQYKRDQESVELKGMAPLCAYEVKYIETTKPQDSVMLGDILISFPSSYNFVVLNCRTQKILGEPCYGYGIKSKRIFTIQSIVLYADNEEKP